MKRLLTLACYLILVSISTSGQDITGLEKIGPVVSFVKTDKAVTFTCRDNSQVQVIVLAPDLIRVRASFTKPIPAKDHSWAIAKENWATPSWNVIEMPESITVSTSELEQVVYLSPLWIDYLDSSTHETVIVDEQSIE